jgi:hypothetical protein
VGNLTPVTTHRRLDLGVGVVLGVIALAVFVVFGVLLPELTEDEVVELPDALPGGWIAADLAPAVDADDASAADRERATDYINDVYADVYTEPVTVRAYTDKELSSFAVVTVFTSDGGAFGPPYGVIDPRVRGLERAPVELVRRGDVMCMATYPEDAEVPTSVGCQLPVGGHTIQVYSNLPSLDDTVDLVHEVADSVGG